jgi:hypothetical protein
MAADSMTAPALAVNVKGKGRHYEHPETGELVPSVTNIIGVLDKPALPRWAAKLVAERAWDLRASLENMDRDEAIDILKGSPWRNSTRAADRGTSIHEYLQAVAEGAPVPELEGDALRYREAADTFLKAYEPVFELTEFTVFGDGYAGTADFMADIAGRSLIGDYKTSKALYPEIALQLAAIRHADWLVTPDGLQPMPEVEGCIGVLLTPDGCDVREVDTGGAYEAFLGCLRAWHWKQAGVDMAPVLWRTA